MDKKNEQTILFEALKLTNDDYLTSKKEEDTIYDNLNKDIAEATKKIKLEYQEKINIVSEKSNSIYQKLETYKKLLKNYSTFDAETIGNIISQLMSINEEKNFSYQTVNYKTYEHEFSVLFETNIKLCMIVNENIKLENWDDLSKKNNTVEKLVNNGDVLVLSIKNCSYDYDKKIKFYTSNDGTLISLIDFGEFSYIKEFIDTVIQYRYENKLENISEKELLNIMKQFILNKKNMSNEKKLKKSKELLSK